MESKVSQAAYHGQRQLLLLLGALLSQKTASAISLRQTETGTEETADASSDGATGLLSGDLQGLDELESVMLNNAATAVGS